MRDPTFIEINRVPVSGKYLYCQLFPKKVALEPAEMLIPLVILDTRYEFLCLPQFQEFAVILGEKGIPLYVICDLNPDLSLSVTAPYPFIFAFDLDLPPSEHGLLKEAAKRFFYSLPFEEVWHLPRFLAFGYTEMKVNDVTMSEAILALDLRKERFCSCPLIANHAYKLGQFKRIIGCPDNLKPQIQKVVSRSVFLCGGEQNVRDLTLYWLDDSQMEQIL